ncbi:hypothetical protein [Siculibacillus lacustris]|uniref:hypothetical protein n=1 Tax=Siculibacillus lacustris TaxID=1549641 RepID=UPI001D1846AA|nr:hypothetical protein [Siculibacillus lacustris]
MAAGNKVGAAVGGFLLGVLVAAGVHGASREHPTGNHGRSGKSGDGNSTTSSDDARNRSLAALAPASARQTAVLKSITPAADLGSVGSTDDRDQIGETRSKDADRDDATLVASIIEALKAGEKKEKASGEGDISQHAIALAVDDAYKRARLDRFASFVGENWTPERLRVMILERVDVAIKALQNGTNKGRVSMSDLRLVIDRAADDVYERLFETSELLGKNRSSTLFVQSLYQAHGNEAILKVRERIEWMLLRGAVASGGEFDALIRRDARVNVLSYRKQRIVFDCLAENIVRVGAAIQGVADEAEIETRINDLAKGECRDWLTNQLTTPDRRLAPQQPMPLRTVWMKEGPVEDPSMYSSQTSIR